MKKPMLLAVTMALLLARPDIAGAEISKGTFRLHLESTFFGFYKGEIDPEGRGDVDLEGISFGIGSPEHQFSLARQSVGFGVTLIPNLVLGARVALALVNKDDENYWDEATIFVMGVSPYVEYVFLDGMWRPFVTGTIGTEGWFGEIHDDDFHLVNFIAGAGGGVHVFLAPQFSVDATALFTFAVGGGEQGSGRGEQDLDFWSVDLSLLLGLSGWL